MTDAAYPKRRRSPPESQAIRPGSVRTAVSTSAWQWGHTVCVDPGPTGITVVTITGWEASGGKNIQSCD